MNQHRRAVPYTTESGLQIGIAWQPKPCPKAAQCGERHTTRRTGLTKYAAWVAFGLFCLLFISARNS